MPSLPIIIIIKVLIVIVKVTENVFLALSQPYKFCMEMGFMFKVLDIFYFISFVFRLFFSGNQPLMSLREWCINCYKLSKEMPVFWCCKFFTLLSFFFRTLLGFRWAYVIYSENWALNRVTTQTWKLNSMTFPWHSSCFQSLRKH